jgi:hypothetical protein
LIIARAQRNSALSEMSYFDVLVIRAHSCFLGTLVHELGEGAEIGEILRQPGVPV